MMTRTAKNIAYVSLTFVVMWVQSGCAGTPQIPPTETVTLTTSTPAATSTPMDTPTLEATSTSTATATVTPTFTPNVTATQLPEITPAAEGKGNVAGLVLWNNQPVPKAAVWLCEKFERACIGKYQYRTNSDQNGYYVFKNVTSGKYVVAINSFSTGWFIFYFDSKGNREQNVSAGKDLILDPWSIWKMDLRPISPRDGKDISEVHPTFTWEPYPDAAYYQFTIYYWDDHSNTYNTVLENKRVDGTGFVLQEVTLVTCSYGWTVEAYNAAGVKISQLKNGIFTSMHFLNHSVPGTC